MIAIKDFKMPENCIRCPMQFGGWCYVSPPDVDERVAPTVDEAYEQGKPDWCPLVDVPDTNVGDMISRQAAIDAVCEEFRDVYCWNCANQDTDYCEDCHRKYMNWSVSRETVESVINGLPSARPTGHWIRDGHHIECSNCGMYMCDTDRECDRIPTDFCPNCGANMRGEQDETD